MAHRRHSSSGANAFEPVWRRHSRAACLASCLTRGRSISAVARTCSGGTAAMPTPRARSAGAELVARGTTIRTTRASSEAPAGGQAPTRMWGLNGRSAARRVGQGPIAIRRLKLNRPGASGLRSGHRLDFVPGAARSSAGQWQTTCAVTPIAEANSLAGVRCPGEPTWRGRGRASAANEDPVHRLLYAQLAGAVSLRETVAGLRSPTPAGSTISARGRFAARRSRTPNRSPRQSYGR